MFRTPFRRSKRSRYLRVVFILTLLLCTIDLVSILSTYIRQPPPPKAADELLIPRKKKAERVYIASIHWNNEAVLRSKWNDAVIDTVKVLGVENVYVSVFESGSWDDSKGALRALNATLETIGVARSIVLDESTHLDEIGKVPGPQDSGWVDTPRGGKELRRIPYLSKLRNVSLRPLAELAGRGIKFDRILFLNDVVFTTEDVIRLLATRDGSYAAACSLDFSKPPNYYDTFALRDFGGYETVTSTFPYFRSKVSRDAMLSGRPVPVQSCWNGIVAFDPTPFYATTPLRFRGIPDSLATHHLEASECCLIHADNPLSKSPSHGVWLNPHVRVGYNADAYAAVHPQRGSTIWPSLWTRVKGIWWNRIRRWTTTPSFFLKAWRVEGRVRRWKRKVGRGSGGGESEPEPGVFCLINEMQVLVGNGWAHV